MFNCSIVIIIAVTFTITHIYIYTQHIHVVYKYSIGLYYFMLCFNIFLLLFCSVIREQVPAIAQFTLLNYKYYCSLLLSFDLCMYERTLFLPETDEKLEFVYVYFKNIKKS